MLKRSSISTAAVLGAALWIAAGCTPAPPPAPQPPASPPVSAVPVPAAKPAADIGAAREAVQQAMQRHPQLFPKSAELKSITLVGDVATLDFNSEFNKLANMGDSTEADAQKQLREALAGFPAIQQMRVTVQGKPFDSQMTDWTTPFPVRQGAGENPPESGAMEKGAKGGAAGGSR